MVLRERGTMNIVSLQTARSRLRPRRPILPPPLLRAAVPPANRAHDADDLDDRLRMKQNVAAIAVTIAIILVGTWLMDSLRYYSRIQMCLEAGHRYCVPLEAKYQPSPY